MTAVVFRLVLLAGGIGLGQMGLDSVAHGTSVALVQFALALVLLVAGSAGFIVPLLGEGTRKEASGHGA
jgi:hypothetical protein